jgi:transaldolase
VFTALQALGIDLDDVFHVLESEGVKKFEESWADLLDTVSRELEQAKSAN